MALSMKVAWLTSLGFIFGMSWLVSQVARPIVELPTPFMARGPRLSDAANVSVAKNVSSRRARREVAPAVAGRFEHGSAVEIPTGQGQREGAVLVVAEASPLKHELPVPVLPPLFIPEAPVVAQTEPAAEGPESSAGPGGPLVAMTWVPEAIVTNAPASGARLLAALRPDPQSDEETDAIAGVESAPATVRRYKVKRGDSLVKIMRRVWDRDDEESLRVLLAANPQVAKRCDQIYPGELLNIPAPDSASSDAAVAQVSAATLNEIDAIRWYTIQKRDSLAAIARRHLNDPERWREIAKLNQLHDADKILPGMRIKLPLLRTDT